MTLQSSIKNILKDKCNQYIDNKIDILKNEINRTKESVANESKSTAGDKHETGRAMMHLEQEKNAAQLKKLIDTKNILNRIDASIQSDTIALGSVVETNHGNFFVSISAGKIEIDSNIYFAISLQSPIGNQLKGKRYNDTFTFNTKTYKVVNVI
ncbi:MAG: GreA/GreB family elongation factor [Bacteroidales bacterium]|jgi:transcription elongation GreA/GreB family factor|nr:GreA/GreB family elongation factor [Bacteroidales bacterium]